MLFSEHFNAELAGDEDWFDVFLTIDTKLFVDPFLLFDGERSGIIESDTFLGSHKEIIDLFSYAFELIASSNGNRKSQSWKRAERLLRFPEVEELCLGYTALGTGGAGSGADVARRIAQALRAAIELGLEELEHFEEVQIFETGIGPDRISDATAGILRHRFARYTQDICKRLEIPTRRIRYPKARFDFESRRWTAGVFNLPMNPYNGLPILLAPKFVLQTLPTINADDFWGYCIDNEVDTLAARFGDEISSRVAKEDIVKLARAHPELRGRYIDWREDRGSEPYDFANDPKGMIAWYPRSREFVDGNPLALSFEDGESFNKFVESIVEQFRLFVQDNGGWSLLWNENKTAKREEASQLLFLGIVKHYCAANNVDISKEANIGRGPVDFKVASGYTRRALIEVKLARNTKFWNGLERQLPTYMTAEEVNCGVFLVIVYNDRDFDRLAGIEERTATVAEQLAYEMTSEVIDATYGPPSASKL